MAGDEGGVVDLLPPDCWGRFGPVYRLWPAGDRVVSPDVHTVTHPLGVGGVAGGRFTLCHQSPCRVMRRMRAPGSASSRAVVAAWAAVTA